MTIKELIESLKEFDQDMLVIIQGDDNEEPHPYTRVFNFDSVYYNGKEFVTIPKNLTHVVL